MKTLNGEMAKPATGTREHRVLVPGHEWQYSKCISAVRFNTK
jgi:hypothetical protein